MNYLYPELLARQRRRALNDASVYQLLPQAGGQFGGMTNGSCVNVKEVLMTWMDIDEPFGGNDKETAE